MLDRSGRPSTTMLFIWIGREGMAIWVFELAAKSREEQGKRETFVDVGRMVWWKGTKSGI